MIFVTNGCKVLNESDLNFNATKRILLGYGIISSNSLTKDEDGYQYFHWNEHGDTEYITGDDGNVLNRYEYDAFGSLTTAEEIIRNRYTYNGEQYDNITSQYYLRARFYNPLVARFTQEDVYRGDGLNLYAYCANNAVMYVDPSGYAKIVPFNLGDLNYPDINAIDYNKLAKLYFGDAPNDMYDPHAHHVSYKSGRGAKQKALVSEIQSILYFDYDINPIVGKEVLCWAPNRVEGQHTLAALNELANDIRNVKNNNGSYDDIVNVLNNHKEIAANRGNKQDNENRNTSKCKK